MPQVFTQPDLSDTNVDTVVDDKLSLRELKEEVGAKRDSLISLFPRSEKSPDDIDVKDYRKMWQNDGQVASIVMLPRLMILGAGYELLPPDEGEETEEYQFIKDNLLGSTGGNGMKTPIEDVIEDMTYFPFEGARFYELVFEQKDGKILLSKIATRDNTTCYPIIDTHGEYGGFWQRAFVLNNFIDVFIPKTKSVALIFNQAYGGVNGLSILRAAWYHWDVKHKLYFISHLAAEIQTIPPVKVTHENADPTVLNAVNQAVDGRGMESRVTVPKGIEIDSLSSGTATVAIKELIDHHNSLIAKSLLSQWIDLGSESGSSGSFALGASQIKVYFNFVKGISRKIEDTFNNIIIPKLIDMNFGSGIYPKFKINPITDESKQLAIDLFKDLIADGKVNPRTLSSIIKKASEDNGFDFDDEMQEEMEKVVEEVNKKKKEIDKTTDKDELVDKEELDNGKDKEEEKETELSEIDGRTLYLDEKKVDFVGQNRELDRLLDTLKNELSNNLTSQQPIIWNEIEQIIRSGNLSRLADLQVANKTEIISTIERTLREVYEFGKLQATKELSVPAESTTSQQKALLTIGSTTNGSKLVDDLKAQIINVVKNDIINNIDITQTERSVYSLVQDYIEKSIPLIADQNIVGTFAQSLNDVFKQNEEDIIGYRFSAVMDSRTTEYCRSLDGKAFEKDDPDLGNITPPCHFRCRSRLVAIPKGEEVEFETRDPKSFNSLYQFRDQRAL